MAKRFLDGLLFGAGFACAFVIIWYLAAMLLAPTVISRQEQRMLNAAATQSGELVSPAQFSGQTLSALPFYDMPIEQKLRRASVIAVVRYEPVRDGKVRAIVAEILKKSADATWSYGVGDEYDPASYYPIEGRSRGDGVIIFHDSASARGALTMTIENDRILSEGDMPLALLREMLSSIES